MARMRDTHTRHSCLRKHPQVISNLVYTYNLCVDPSDVSFVAYPANDLDYCDTDASLATAVQASSSLKATSVEGKQAAEVTLTLHKDNLNAQSLGAAYISDSESA